MGARLRVVLDQLGHVVDADQAAASVDLMKGLIATTPSGCEIEAIVAAGAEIEMVGLAGVRRLSLARRELAASWQLGIAPGVGGGLIHAPTLMAPLVRHDRVHDNDQTTVTLWDLHAWEAADMMSKTAVAWQRGMLRRAVKHADAVIVPSHAFAERLVDLAKVGERVRVIAGAAPAGYQEPSDAPERRTDLALPAQYVVLIGSHGSLEEGFRGAAAAGLDAVVLDVSEGAEPRLAEIASAAGLPEQRAHMRGVLSAQDRASVLAGAAAFVATSALTAWPWRVIEAMTLGVPVVAVDSGVHRDVVADGGMLVDASELAEAVVEAAGRGASRLKVLGADRSRAFSWASAAEKVWALHAEL
ncbi:glycosyltransferase [Microbacterium sp. LWH12-1.2]|uniref:glycosyltransferase n=1 Tax=Microbacterium sp. LWH12-1.2 TaxID=3135259 RepID=UPI00341F978E